MTKITTTARRFECMVIGAGPAGLMAAERLALGGASVTVYDHMASPARKLLMAGVGGLNITHDEPFPALLDRYGPAAEHMRSALTAFPPDALRAWCAALGQPTFVGSSRRVFPVAMKASPLLRAWLGRLHRQGVRLALRRRWLGWDEAGKPILDGPAVAAADATVLAVGGASWPRLGSDGNWVPFIDPAAITPLRPANCGFLINWSDHFRNRFAGAPLKRITVQYRGKSASGDAVVTAAGLEGGPFYALSAQLRDGIAAAGTVAAWVDLRPDLPEASLQERLQASGRRQSMTNLLRKAAGLSPVAIGLVRECADPSDGLARAVKHLAVPLHGTDRMSRAISTAGGVRWSALDGLALRPGVFIAGEMLDWEAPTGGYLLQGAFSTGYAAGEAALAWLNRSQ